MNNQNENSKIETLEDFDKLLANSKMACPPPPFEGKTTVDSGSTSGCNGDSGPTINITVNPTMTMSSASSEHNSLDGFLKVFSALSSMLRI